MFLQKPVLFSSSFLSHGHPNNLPENSLYKRTVCVSSSVLIAPSARLLTGKAAADLGQKSPLGSVASDKTAVQRYLCTDRQAEGYRSSRDTHAYIDEDGDAMYV